MSIHQPRNHRFKSQNYCEETFADKLPYLAPFCKHNYYKLSITHPSLNSLKFQNFKIRGFLMYIYESLKEVQYTDNDRHEL